MSAPVIDLGAVDRRDGVGIDVTGDRNSEAAGTRPVQWHTRARARETAGSDHPDKTAYPTLTFDITAATLPDVLAGEVVWIGRSLAPDKAR